MRRILQNAFLWIYRIVFANGLLRYRWGHRCFFVLYDVYKLLFEAGPIAGLQTFVPPGAAVIDVGANVGFFTIRFAQWAGPNGRVIAIEPEQTNITELERRVASNGFSNRIMVCRAVADHSAGEVRLVVNRDHPGDHHLGNEGVAVPAVTLDDLVASEGRAPALIKIDVQGAEMRVLAGAEAVLAQHCPVLFIEVDPAGFARFGSSTDALLAFLARFDYIPHALERGGIRQLTPPMVDDLLKRKGYTDLLFIARATL
jgi:FkbM family methyltransferase